MVNNSFLETSQKEKTNKKTESICKPTVKSESKREIEIELTHE